MDINSGDGDGVKVFETNGLRGKYPTLSHCWGNPGLMSTRLTASNLEEYKRGIPFDYLPRTFQDAVTATRSLGFQYLWIDSHLTLAAASATACTGGLFFDSATIVREPSRNMRDTLTTIYTNTNTSRPPVPLASPISNDLISSTKHSPTS